MTPSQDQLSRFVYVDQNSDWVKASAIARYFEHGSSDDLLDCSRRKLTSEGIHFLSQSKKEFRKLGISAPDYYEPLQDRGTLLHLNDFLQQAS